MPLMICLPLNKNPPHDHDITSTKYQHGHVKQKVLLCLRKNSTKGLWGGFSH